MSIKRIFTALGFFTGCGGSSLGLREAGFHELFAFDFDKNSVETHRLNFPETQCIQAKIDQSPKDGTEPTSRQVKILLRKISEQVRIDIIQFSPPCQYFSSCNITSYDEEKIKPFFDSIDIINELQPKTFMIENVEGVLSPANIKIWNKLKKAMDKTGYSYRFKILNASDFGVPQDRRRLIIVGVHPDLVKLGFNPVFPKPFDINRENLTINKVLPSKPKFFSTSQFKDSIHSGNEICDTITKTPNLKLYDSLSEPPRRGTIEEYKTLTSFPKKFRFIGSYNDKVNRMGNAVPPKLAYAIAMAIRKGILDPYYDLVEKDGGE